MRTLLTNATLIDSIHPRATPGASVLIADGRIRDIRTDGNRIEAGDATEIDLRGACLMPGLWDVHIHPDYLSLAEMPLADQVACVIVLAIAETLLLCWSVAMAFTATTGLLLWPCACATNSLGE